MKKNDYTIEEWKRLNTKISFAQSWTPMAFTKREEEMIALRKKNTEPAPKTISPVLKKHMQRMILSPAERDKLDKQEQKKIEDAKAKKNKEMWNARMKNPAIKQMLLDTIKNNDKKKK